MPPPAPTPPARWLAAMYHQISGAIRPPPPSSSTTDRTRRSGTGAPWSANSSPAHLRLLEQRRGRRRSSRRSAPPWRAPRHRSPRRPRTVTARQLASEGRPVAGSMRWWARRCRPASTGGATVEVATAPAASPRRAAWRPLRTILHGDGRARCTRRRPRTTRARSPPRSTDLMGTGTDLSSLNRVSFVCGLGTGRLQIYSGTCLGGARRCSSAGARRRRRGWPRAGSR